MPAKGADVVEAVPPPAGTTSLGPVERADVCVVGGGVVGLAAAWELACTGRSVLLLDDARPGRASAVAAGMLAPVTEAEATEPEALRRGLAAAAAWPDWAGRLEASAGSPVGLRREGTLEVAVDAGDRVALDRLADLLARHGVEAQRLGSREARQLEPLLDPGVRGGLLVPGDHSVDPRRLTAALDRAARAAGAQVARAVVTAIDAGTVEARRPGGGTTQVVCGAVVVAAGSWSARLVPELAVRPVKGQVLRLRGPAGLLPTRTVRAMVSGSPVYLVPRLDGELVVGATMEERADVEVTAGGVWQLLRDATAVLPAVRELELVEAAAGLRPVSPGNEPLVRTLAPGVVVASGHGRNGVLLAPTVGPAVRSAITGVAAGDRVGASA